MKITTSNGTIIEDLAQHGDRVITINSPQGIEGPRNVELGRIAEMNGNFGFQPAPFVAWALGPETLRAIAQIVDSMSE